MFQALRCPTDLHVKIGVKNELERGQQTCVEMFLLCRRDQDEKVTFQQPQNVVMLRLGFQGLREVQEGLWALLGRLQGDELSSALWGGKCWARAGGSACAGIVAEGSPWCPRQSFGLIPLCLLGYPLMSFMKRPRELVLDQTLSRVGLENLFNYFWYWAWAFKVSFASCSEVPGPVSPSQTPNEAEDRCRQD